MTYRRTVDIWTLSPTQRAALTPGQWVTAGGDGPKGRYMGQTARGTDVVAWADNARGKRGYGATLRAYALSAGKGRTTK